VETSANTTSKAITSKPVTNVPLDFNTVYKSGQSVMKLEDFCDAFPHHFCFNRDLVLEHVGTYIKKAYPWIKGGETRLVDVLDLIHPEIPLTYDSIRAFRNSLFVFQMKESAEQTAGTTVTGSGTASASMSVMLKGSMVYVHDNNYVVFVCSLNVTTVRDLLDRNLFISDMQRHDSTRDLIMLNQSRMSQVELK
uniref:guanylate cyclase n=1 Tax=Acrobeloides nanus TaxID=290746 RepID=A0A914D681_9BILA